MWKQCYKAKLANDYKFLHSVTKFFKIFFIWGGLLGPDQKLSAFG